MIEPRSNLTRSQLLIWTGQQLSPAAPLYNMALAFTFNFDVNVSVFQKCFGLLVAESDAMRTVMTAKNGVPWQTILAEPPAQTEFIDISDASEADQIRRWLDDRSGKQFSLHECLYDSVLLKCGDSEFRWFLNQHHLITDAWSFTVCYRRLSELYTQVSQDLAAEEHQPSYADFIRKEHEQRDNGSAHWQQRRAKSATPLELFGRSEQTQSGRTTRVTRHLDRDIASLLRATAGQPPFRGFTEHLSCFNLFATLLVAWLHRMTGEKEIAFASPAHNRTTTAEKETIGLFIELLPLKVHVDADETFASLSTKVQREVGLFLRNAKPGSSTPDLLRGINVVLNYINATFDDFCGHEVQSEWIHPGHCDPGHHLRLQVQDFDGTGDFSLHFDLSDDLYETALQQAAADQFLEILDALLDDCEQQICQVEQSFPEHSSTKTPGIHSQSSPDHQDLSIVKETPNVLARFENCVYDKPHATALSEHSSEWSYEDLNARAEQIALTLDQKSVSEGDRVVLVLPRSADVVAAMLAVWKSGAAFTPIDISFPAERIRFIIEDLAPSAVVVSSTTESLVPASAAPLLVNISRRSTNRKDAVVQRATVRNAASSTAYILYTSGSTGQPKGVVISHAAIANYVDWACRTYAAEDVPVIPLFTSLSFDLTLTSILVPLACGGRTVVYPDSVGQGDFTLLNVLRDNTVNIIKLTPSHLSLLRGQPLLDSRVKQLILGGEDLKTELARTIVQKFGDAVQIYNEYGPTEATIGCILHTFDPLADTAASVPIGHPIDGMGVYLLSDQLTHVRDGKTGELYLAGTGLADGYWKHPALSDERFLSDPFNSGQKMYRTGDLARRLADGTLMYSGRTDTQIKLRGVRIETAEIEAALQSHPDLENCLVGLASDHSSADDSEITWCVDCGLPSNYPDVTFDDRGQCSHCSAFNRWKDKTAGYFQTIADLQRVFDSARTDATEYDCISLLSGGKDSTYALCRLVDMGLRVLAFTLDNGYLSDEAKANINRVVTALGVDHTYGSTPAMNAIFVDSLNRHANVCQGCFKTVYTLSMQEACRRGIRYIVTGLSRGQFFETRLTEELFHHTNADLTIIDQTILDARKAYHRVDDAVRQHLDTDMFADDKIFDELTFVDFYRYCDVSLGEMLAYLDQRVAWVRPVDTGRSTNCLINDVGIYIHRKNRGFHNYAFPYSWDVRMGHKTRDEALHELHDEIDVANVQRILNEVGYNEDDASKSTADVGGERLVAWYTASRKLSVSQLRSHLQAHLPASMMPQQFVPLNEMPLTVNGKIDRSALPTPGNVRVTPDESWLAPRTAIEESLARIWKAVIRVEHVGVHDNYHELGGDSIMAIQIVVRAGEMGLNFTPWQLFEALTVEKLAAVCGTAPATSGDQGIVSGPIVLTPIQRWFFEQKQTDYHHWNQSFRVQLSEAPDAELLAESLLQIGLHHDALRLSFSCRSGKWSAGIETEFAPPELIVHNVNNMDDNSRCRLINDVETSLDLSRGPLFKAVLFTSANAPPELLLCVHHLAADAVSWGILLEDLATVYKQLLAGNVPKLPAKTSSYQQWSQALQEHAQSETVVKELEYWRKTLQTVTASLPVDFTNGEDAYDNIERYAETQTVQLNRDQTLALLEQLPRVYRIKADEVLIAALCITLSQWTGSRTISFNQERHGREHISANIDVSRTVGWCTSVFPVAITLPDSSDRGALLSCVKDHLRSIPNHGIGHGLLRYMDAKDEARHELSDFSQPGQPEAMFNYLGRTDQLVPQNSMFLKGDLSLSRSPTAVRPHLLEINAIVANEVLTIDWSFSTRRHARTTIQTVAENFLLNLQSLVDHCLTTQKNEFAVTDLPLAKLDQGKLNKLSALLQKADQQSGTAR